MAGGFKPLQWDIFCKVIDNFGDIGICWRVAADLASRGHAVRLWVDDAGALAWMAPGGHEGVTVLAWTQVLQPQALATLQERPCDVIVEAFSCEVAPEFIAVCAEVIRATGRFVQKPAWINLEYLSAEPYVERCHGLPSPVQSGPAAGWTKWFFYPGFSRQTGGLLREPGLFDAQAGFDRDAWLASQGLSSAEVQGRKLISLFCYEPSALPGLVRKLIAEGLDGQPVQLLVAAGRPQKAVHAVLNALECDTKNAGEDKNIDEISLRTKRYLRGLLSILFLPQLTQDGFDRLLWSCDLNFVRGEDSLVRAIWAQKPFVWQIYPQDDGAHVTKLDAFLNVMQAPPSLRDFHVSWNSQVPDAPRGTLPPAAGPAPDAAAIGDIDLRAWAESTAALRSQLSQQDDLCTQLLSFVQKNR